MKSLFGRQRFWLYKKFDVRWEINYPGTVFKKQDFSQINFVKFRWKQEWNIFGMIKAVDFGFLANYSHGGDYNIFLVSAVAFSAMKNNKNDTDTWTKEVWITYAIKKPAKVGDNIDIWTKMSACLSKVYIKGEKINSADCCCISKTQYDNGIYNNNVAMNFSKLVIQFQLVYFSKNTRTYCFFSNTGINDRDL